MDEKELLKRLAAAKTQNEYDKLIDRYIFKIDKKHRNTKKRRRDEENILSTNQIAEIKKIEKPYDFSKPWL